MEGSDWKAPLGLASIEPGDRVVSDGVDSLKNFSTLYSLRVE